MRITTKLLVTATMALLGTSGVTVAAAAETGPAVPDAAATQYYEVRAQHSDKCLDVRDQSQAHGADVIQGDCWGGGNQHWRLVQAS